MRKWGVLLQSLRSSKGDDLGVCCIESQWAYNRFGFLCRNGGRMEFLLDPNIAYFVLVVAILFVLIALAVPGTGVPEVLALSAMLLAGYAVYHLSVNWWALALLLLSLAPFYFSVRG